MQAVVSFFNLYVPFPYPESTCPPHSAATLLPPLLCAYNAMSDILYHPLVSTLCNLSSGFHLRCYSHRLVLVHGRWPLVWRDRL